MLDLWSENPQNAEVMLNHERVCSKSRASHKITSDQIGVHSGEVVLL